MMVNIINERVGLLFNIIGLNLMLAGNLVVLAKLGMLKQLCFTPLKTNKA